MGDMTDIISVLEDEEVIYWMCQWIEAGSPGDLNSFIWDDLDLNSDE